MHKHPAHGRTRRQHMASGTCSGHRGGRSRSRPAAEVAAPAGRLNLEWLAVVAVVVVLRLRPAVNAAARGHWLQVARANCLGYGLMRLVLQVISKLHRPAGDAPEVGAAAGAHLDRAATGATTAHDLTTLAPHLGRLPFAVGRLQAQHAPWNVRAHLFAQHGATELALDRRAVLRRDPISGPGLNRLVPLDAEAAGRADRATQQFDGALGGGCRRAGALLHVLSYKFH